MSAPETTGSPSDGAPDARTAHDVEEISEVLVDSDPDTSGDLGVTSGIEGPTGPGQHATTGTRYVGAVDRDPDADVAPEQAAGGPETNPDPPSPPRAAPSSYDPRSDS